MLRWLKPVVERYPRMARLYRDVRDSLLASGARPLPTPFGFVLAGNEVMGRGAFEVRETAFVRRRIEQADVFVDVGSHVGYYSCLARQRGLHVVAVEPDRANLVLLYANLAANGWDDVEVFPVAVAASPGVRPMFGGGTGASLVRDWSGATDAHRALVPVSTLDVLLGSRFAGKRLIVKLDVEGSEYDALRGAAGLVEQSPRPLWIVEVCLTEHHPSGLHEHFLDVFEMFWSRGYRSSTIEGEREVERADVLRWVETRVQDFGGHNFVFEARS